MLLFEPSLQAEVDQGAGAALMVPGRMMNAMLLGWGERPCARPIAG